MKLRNTVLLFLLYTISLCKIGNIPVHDVIQIDIASSRSNSRLSVVKFSALNKTFHLLMKPVRPPVDSQLRVVDSDGVEESITMDEMFEGHEYSRPFNKARLMTSHGGAYLGSIYSNGETYYLEPASTFDDKASEKDTVIYRASDLNLNDLWNKFISKSKVLLPPDGRGSSVNYLLRHPFVDWNRPKRETSSLIPSEKRNRCPLKVVADFYFYRAVGKKSAAITTRYIFNMVANVNEYFKAVDWDGGNDENIEGRGRFVNFGFSIKEVKILTRYNNTPGHYNSQDEIESNALLEAFTLHEASDKFCLVHLLTARTFKDASALGVAYVAVPSQLNGGICSDPHTSQGTQRPFNTVFTSAVGSTNLPLVTREAEIVVAHEYGHSWGAEHDSSSLSERYKLGNDVNCVPDYRGGGSYIMNEYAQPGFDPNNYKFSPCSIHKIRRILEQRFERCFEEEQQSFCGNGVVEQDEECDEGALLSISSDRPSCCLRNCTLRTEAQCSPQNHPCCSNNCNFYENDHICLNGSSWLCKGNSYCTGNSGECPPPPALSDGIECEDDGECQAGQCVPFCEKAKIGMKSCLCEDKALSCHRCCRSLNGTDQCEPYPSAEKLRDGSFCVQGTCRSGECVSELADYMKFYRNVFQDSSFFWSAVSSNIVGIIILISVPLWCAIGYWIRLQDKRQLKRQAGKSDARLKNVEGLVVPPEIAQAPSPSFRPEADSFF